MFILSACFFEVQAQVQYGLSFDRKRYLQYEKIQVTFTVVNNSGTRLAFGANERSGKLKLLVVDPENRLIPAYDVKFNPMNGLVLAAGETKSLVFNINEHFSLTRLGDFKVSASMTHPTLTGLAFETPQTTISVQSGTMLKKKTFGVVDLEDSNMIHARSYEIIAFKEEEGDIVCLKVYDKKWVYALLRLGPYVTGVKVNHDVDTFSNIHTMIQVKPRVFIHMVFSDTGAIKQFIVYRATFENVPIMTRDSKLGTVRIFGGEKLVEGEDFIRVGNTLELRNVDADLN
ncbi:hypothetical protein PQO03_14520 [Lentisphaera profundi]|uniref:Uncharacterized protein n=1 Tax=Lentisphaera profundi TaxID=1658616 RepID=A0ABY7VXV1_9BACT|nr:hypothetical protein [Lentisphaera profundi]WDE99048.1 hypothetical protein PQO03_14520 [Lentisphaera profundi]